jgi:hypothetical protein
MQWKLSAMKEFRSFGELASPPFFTGPLLILGTDYIVVGSE